MTVSDKNDAYDRKGMVARSRQAGETGYSIDHATIGEPK